MELHTLGINYRHDGNFVIDRPNGSGDELLLIFKTPARVRIAEEIVTVPADSAVVYDGRYPQYYGADGDEYINHWVHFDACGDTAFFERISLPFNTILPVTDIEMTESVLEQLNREAVTGGVNSAECIDLLLRLLLARLGGETRSAAASHHSAALKSLRAQIYRNPAGVYSIAELASQLMLSGSHFQYLYKREFGVSCYEDIISARLDMACYYLRDTSLPIKAVAELCGYENDVHFIRQFKKRLGMTAGDYRKQV